MPLDPHAKRLLDMLALSPSRSVGSMTAAGRRAGFKALMTLSRQSSPIGEVTDHTIAGAAGGLRVRLYVPDEARAEGSPGLVFFHGGGLVAGDLDTHDGLCRRLANEAGCRVVAVDYRLAPEHPFPAAAEDAVAAVRAIATQAVAFGIDPARLAVGGDSAGGTLAAVAAAAHPGLRFQLLLCPVLDHGERRPSRLAFGTGFLLDQLLMDRDLADCLPAEADPADPRISPIRTPDLSGLPPTLLHTAEFDPVRDEGRDYADALRRAGVAVAETCHAGMIHHFLGLDGVIPAATTALRAIGAEARRAFSASA